MPRTLRLVRWIPALLLPALPAWAQSAPTPAAAHFAGLLANDARDALRNPNLPADAAATQASILLEFAVQLDGTDLRTLHLLAQAAQAAGRTDVRRDALRKIIAADTGDLRAQVDYIDLLADASQNAEDRMATYSGPLSKAQLDPQVRSELALRLARLAEGRGDLSACRNYLAQALTLNSVNIGALRDQVRLAASETPGPDAFNHHVQALVALLTANPYQADAWMQAAQICQSAGVHDRAADFLQTAVEQNQIDGNPLSLDLLLDASLELALAGRRGEAYAAASGLAKIPEAPLALLLEAQALAEDTMEARPASSQPLDRAADIRQRLADMAKQTDDPAALADAAGAALTTFSVPGPEVATWVADYEKLVKKDDATLARLKGWLAYRQNDLPAALAALQGATDPLAQVALARVLLAQAHADQAGKILQDLWNANPTGLLALQIVLAARKGNLTLSDPPTTQAVRPLLARLTPQLAAMHRQPGNTVLLAASYRKPFVGPGEPVVLELRMTNATDHPLPVGADGIVKSTVGLAAAARGPAAAALGLYAVEDLQRVYRLEPHQMVESTLRADQGRLADLLQKNPGGTYAVDVTLITAPRVLSATEFSTGVGGQAVALGDFQRGGLPAAATGNTQDIANNIKNQTGDRQLIAIDTAGALLAQADHPDLSTALAALAGSADPMTRAAVVRILPMSPAQDLARAVAPFADDGDPLVRLLWARRQAQSARAGGDAAALAQLEKLALNEKDQRVKAWLDSALPLARAAATQPAAK